MTVKTLLKFLENIPAGTATGEEIAAGDSLVTALYKAQGQIDAVKDRVTAVEANVQGSAIIDLTGVVGTYQMTQEDSQKGVLVFLNDDTVTTVSLYDSQQNPSRYLLLSCPSVEKPVPTNFRCGLNNNIVSVPGTMYTEVVYGYYQAYEFGYAKLQEYDHGDIKVEGDLLTWNINNGAVSFPKLDTALQDRIEALEINAQGTILIDVTGTVGDYYMTREQSLYSAILFFNNDIPSTLNKIVLYDADDNPSTYRFMYCALDESNTTLRASLDLTDIPLQHGIITDVWYGYTVATEFFNQKLQSADYGDVKVEADHLTWTIRPDKVSANKLTQAVRDDIASRQLASEKGQANGYASLDASSKIPADQLPDALVGAVKFKGFWNATTGIVTSADLTLNGLPPPAAAPANEGFYFITQVGGSYSIGGTTDWKVGDWLLSYGANWTKIDNTDAVSSVNGHTGIVTLTKSDIGLGDVDNTSDADKPISTATQNALNGKLDKSYSAFGTFVSASPAHPTLDDSDLFPVMDGLAAFFSKKISFAQLKTELSTYFSTIYQAILTNASLGTLMQSGGIKVPVDADTIPFMDSASSFEQKKTSMAALKNFLFSNPIFTGIAAAQTAAPNTSTAQLATTQFVVIQNQTAATQTAPANPTSTTSLTGVMMGLAASITPVRKGSVLITITGDIETSGNGNGGALQIRTGTGAAPANGVAATGTAQGSIVNYRNPANSVVRVPFSASAIVSGLTLGTAIWIDLGLAAVTGGTAAVRNVSISAAEL